MRTTPSLYSPKMRLLVYLSDICLLAAVGALAASIGTGWSWWLFVWGAALGVLFMAGNELLVRVAVRIVRHAASDLERMRSRRHDQRLMVFPSAITMGCAVGVLAAGLQSAVPDVLMTVGVVVFEAAVPLAMVPWLRRRVAEGRSVAS